MSKEKIKLGAVSVLLLASVFVLSGCGQEKQAQKDQTQAQTQDQEQNQFQAERMEQGGAGVKVNQNVLSERADVCNGKSEGDSCEMTLPVRNGEEERKITGTCAKMRNDEVLICRPEGGMGGPGRNNMQQPVTTEATE